MTYSVVEFCLTFIFKQKKKSTLSGLRRNLLIPSQLCCLSLKLKAADLEQTPRYPHLFFFKDVRSTVGTDAFAAASPSPQPSLHVPPTSKCEDEAADRSASEATGWQNPFLKTKSLLEEHVTLPTLPARE